MEAIHSFDPEASSPSLDKNLLSLYVGERVVILGNLDFLKNKHRQMDCTQFHLQEIFIYRSGFEFLKNSKIFRKLFLISLLNFQTFRVSISYFSTLQGYHFLSRKYSNNVVISKNHMKAPK